MSFSLQELGKQIPIFRVKVLYKANPSANSFCIALASLAVLVVMLDGGGDVDDDDVVVAVALVNLTMQ